MLQKTRFLIFSKRSMLSTHLLARFVISSRSPSIWFSSTYRRFLPIDAEKMKSM